MIEGILVLPELILEQEYGAQWLANKKRALLADEMGVGKSAQAIRAGDLVTATRITVLCPAIALYNWKAEFEKFGVYDLPVRLITTGRDRLLRSGVNIISYNLASTPRIYRAITATQPQVLILDEGHFLKNREALRTRVVFGSKGPPAIKGLAEFAEYVFVLSGTPMPKDPGDLWVYLHHLGAYPGSYSKFEKEFCKGFLGDRGFKITGVKNVKRLKELLKQIMLRRKLRDVMDKEIPVYIDAFTIPAGEVDPETAYGLNRTELTDKQKHKIGRGDDQIKEALDCSNDDSILEALSGLKVTRDSPVSTIRRLTGLQKVEASAEFIKDKLDNYVDNVVVFALHRAVIQELTMKLREYNPVVIYGGTKPKKKESNRLKFERGRSRVAILNIAAAGTAIRFKTSKAVVFVEAAWNPTDNAQAISRCLWLEREEPLPVWYLSLADSYDESVNRVLARKTDMTNAVFD